MWLFFNLLQCNWGGVIAQESPNKFPTTGKVGIGIDRPTSKLHVVGDIKLDELPASDLPENNNDFFLKIDENGNIYQAKGPYTSASINTGDPVTDECLIESQDRQHPVWKNGIDKLYPFCPEVRVGIGTRNPRAKLDVVGNAYVSRLTIGSADPAQNTFGLNHIFWLKSAVTDGSPQGQTPIFVIENGSRKLFQIQNDGLVRAREIKVDLATNWPDYVFHSTYSLMPLNDVKTFIGKNGHLPNVPSACEIEEDGIPLGEMNRVLLEKVEELTLYMIKMQEEQERLKAELEELKTKNLGR